nr:hypothetical protein GCM10020092_077440 [Actinoplanes digitatis]
MPSQPVGHRAHRLEELGQLGNHGGRRVAAQDGTGHMDGEAAHAPEVGGHLNRGHGLAQVVGDRLPASDQVVGPVLGDAVEHVDLGVAGGHL